jgi:hypothetical protein
MVAEVLVHNFMNMVRHNIMVVGTCGRNIHLMVDRKHRG